MDKLECLEKCLEHWEYMSKTGSRRKADFLERKGIPEENWPEETCYCCEYDTKKNEDCLNCPLNDYAWDATRCCGKGSVYWLWAHSGFDKRKEHAAMMVYACEWAIKDLKENQQD